MATTGLFTGQRRFITVLAIETHGAASADDSMPARLIDICTAHGGTANQISATALLCDFGAAAPTEDHAFSAFTAAQKMIAALNSDNQNVPDVRIAVCSGDVTIKRPAVADTGVHIITGDALGIATRVVKTVPANTILVNERAASQLSKYFTFVKVFGLANTGQTTIGVYKKTANIPAIATIPTPAVRSALQQEIRAVLLRTDATPVWLQGDAGIGKSFLAEQALRDMQEEGVEKTVRIVFYPQPAVNPASIERRLLGALFPTGLDAMQTAAHDPALDDTDNATMVGDCLRDIMGWDKNQGATSGYALLDAASKMHLRRRVTATALGYAQRQSKTALLFEDMHWASNDEVQTISTLLSGLGKLQPTVIFTSRHSPTFTALLAERLRVFTIPTLSHSQSERLLGNLSRQTKLPQEAIERLHRLSAGNPYFLKEYFSWLRTALRSGATLEDALYQIDSEMPGEIANVLQTRLSRLGAAALSLAKTASIQGLRVDAEILTVMTGLSSAEVARLLTHMQDCGIMRENDTGDGWEFAHEIMQRAIYTSIPAAQRPGLHAEAMRHLRARGGSDIYATLAYHARHAEMPPYDYVYSKWAARQAKAQSQHESALAHLTLARKALRRMRGSFNRTRHDAIIKFDEIGSLFITSRYAAVKTRIKDVLQAKGHLLGTAILKEALSFQGLMHWVNGETAKAAQIYTAILKNSSPTADRGLYLRESVRLAHICIDLGHYQKSIDYAEEALRAVKDSDIYLKYGLLTQVGPTLLSCLALAKAKRGNYKEARRHHEQAMSMLRGNQDYFTHVYVATLLAHGLIIQNQPGEAADLLRSALYNCTIVESTLLKPYILSGLGLALARLGRAAEGLSYGAAAIDIAQKIHLQSRRPLFYAWYAETLMVDQQYEAALPILKKAVKGAIAFGEEGRLAYAYYLMAECYKRTGLQKSEDWLLLYKKARIFAKNENVVPLHHKLDAAEALIGHMAYEDTLTARHG